MTTTLQRLLAPTAAVGILLSLPAAASAHGGDAGDPRVQLHISDAYEVCHFDLHPELTEEEFRQFAAEGGQIVRFRQISAADTLGAGTFEVNLEYEYMFIDDTRGAWNNTMSHPDAEHYLGEQLGFPILALGLGVTDSVDVEVFGTLSPGSNYGFLGAASKIRIFEHDIGGAPLSISVRPSVSGLIGPSEMQALNVSTDLSMSIRVHGLAPFVGVTWSSTLAFDSSDDTDVGHQGVSRGIAFAGLDYNWRFLTVGAQAEIGEIPGLALRAGGRF